MATPTIGFRPSQQVESWIGEVIALNPNLSRGEVAAKAVALATKMTPAEFLTATSIPVPAAADPTPVPEPTPIPAGTAPEPALTPAVADQAPAAPVPADPAPVPEPTHIPAGPAAAPAKARPVRLVLAGIGVIAAGIGIVVLILSLTAPAPAPASRAKPERVEALETRVKALEAAVVAAGAKITTLEKDRQALIADLRDVTDDQYKRIESVEKKLKPEPAKPLQIK